MFHRLHGLIALVALLGAGCSFSVDYEHSNFACDDGRCPSGFECLARLCTPVSEPDAAGGPPGPVADAGPSCDGPDELFDPASGHCYFLERNRRVWDDAVAACAARDPRSHLVIVTSPAESTLISQLGDGTLSGFAWLGATDTPSEGDWRWLDGSDFPPSPLPNRTSYAGWHAGEPNDGGQSGVEQDCATISLSGVFIGDWDDSRCDDLRASICETE